jgi:hypothetical protein
MGVWVGIRNADISAGFGFGYRDIAKKVCGKRSVKTPTVIVFVCDF